MNLLIDIDGTVSEDIPNEEYYRFRDAKLIKDALECVNKLYDIGHTITFFTSRKEEYREITEKWLKENGFKYDGLIMNKPRGGKYIWIDNLEVHGIQYKYNWKVILGEVHSKL